MSTNRASGEERSLRELVWVGVWAQDRGGAQLGLTPPPHSDLVLEASTLSLMSTDLQRGGIALSHRAAV